MKKTRFHRPGRRAGALVLAGAVAVSLAACGGSSAGGGGGGGGGAGVSLITKTSTNPFFVAMQNGAKESATKDGVKLTLAAGKADGDEATQITAIENSIARGDKGILITPNGPGVNSAIKRARDAGLLVIALDTPPDPPSTVDVTFATDNFLAGKLIGQWAAKKMGGKPVVIALLDLFSDKVVSVDYNRDQGFLTGMGIPTGDIKKNGDEAPTGSYSGGSYTIVCNLPTQGAEDGGRTAMENCLSKNPNINLLYTINEPAASGAYKALQAANKKATIVSVDGGCDPGMTLVKSGVIGATSQQYPLKMASLGVDAVAKYAKDKTKPTTSSGLDFYNTGVSLVTDDPQDGVESIDSAKGLAECWGTKA
jgi:fructose transport system substrate-binding protein